MPTLSVNMNIFAPTQYGNFQFGDICNFRGKLLCGGHNGTFLFGENDNDNGKPILSEIELFTTDFGTANLKHPRFIIIGAKLNGNLSISIKVDGVYTFNHELVCGRKMGVWHNYKIPVSRECDGRYFTITIKNIAGKDFVIDSVDMIIYQRHRGDSF